MLSTFRWIATLLLLILGIAAISFSNVVETTGDALGRVMRYDVAWSGAQGRQEAARLQTQTVLFVSGEGSRADLQLAYDIILNRMQIWNSGDFRSFLDRNERAAERFVELQEAISRFGNWLGGDQHSPKDLLEVADAIKRQADRLGTNAHTASVNDIAEIREALRGKQELQRSLIYALFAVGLVLIGMTLFQNRSLRLAGRASEENAKRMQHLARHDLLTNLVNRAGFNIAFSRTFGGTNAGQSQVAILATDLDGFKAINDTLGHAAGDALLQSVGRRLSECVASWNPRNVVSRFGGDEFVIMLFLDPGTDPVGLAHELRDLLRAPHELEVGSVFVDATIGVALSGASTEVNARLPIDADLALTKAKATGKGTVLLFNASMRQEFARQVELERDLEQALNLGQIVAHYQPLVDLATGRVVGVEALARWHHPSRGWISPAEFIPVAEASGQIVTLGRAVLRAACCDGLLLPEHITMSVNMSVAQLMRTDVVDEIMSLLESSGFPAERLKLEVTESVVMEDAARGLAVLQRLKAAGIRIALDDFGTGYSALSYLHQFPWDQLKIDRSFIEAMGSDERSKATVESVIALAGRMGIEVVAEGIEERWQEQLLLKHNCEIGQGYLFGRPMPLEELSLFLLRSVHPSHPPFLLAGNGS